MDWLDLLAVQGTLKSLLQHHSSNTSILWCSAFFTVQLSHPYMTTGKTIALTRRTLVSKVMSLLLNILSRLVITFLARSKRLLISWLQSPSTVILEPKKIKSDTEAEEAIFFTAPKILSENHDNLNSKTVFPLWNYHVTDSMDMNLSKPWEIMKDRGAWSAAVHGVTKSWTGLSNWITSYSTIWSKELVKVY